MKRYLLIALTALMALSASAREFEKGEKLYFNGKPKDASWWMDDYRLWAYFFNGTSNQWIEAKQYDSNTVFYVEFTSTANWTHVILTRHAKWVNDPKFDSNCITQTGDIDLNAAPSDKNYIENFYYDYSGGKKNGANWWNLTFYPIGKPSGSSVDGIAKELMSVCTSSTGDPLSLQPVLAGNPLTYDYNHSAAHAWFKWDGSAWKPLDGQSTGFYSGSNAWGYEGGSLLKETIGAENSHTYYFLWAEKPSKRRFIEVAVTENCSPTCEITDFGVVTSSVNAHDSTYTLDGVVAFGDASDKTLRISVEDKKGKHYKDFKSPTTPFIFSLPDLYADGTSGLVAKAEFLGTECSLESSPYTAPNAIEGVKTVSIQKDHGEETTLTPSTSGTDGFKWNDGNTTDHERTIPAYNFDTTIIYTYYEFEKAPEVSGNLIKNGDFSDDSFNYGTPYYKSDIKGSNISQYNFWGKDVTSSSDFYDDPAHKDGGNAISGGMAIVTNANKFWKRYTKKITPKAKSHFALFDADNSGSKKAWYIVTNNTTQPDLKLAKGTNYMFSFWVANINNYGEMNNAAKLQFAIRYKQGSTWSSEKLLGKPIDLSEYPDNLWHQNSHVFVSDVNSSEVEIMVRDLNTSANPGGNDFALDDIRFGPISVVSQAIKSCERFVVKIYEEPCTFQSIKIDTIRPKCTDDANKDKYNLKITLKYDKAQGILTLKDNIYGALTPKTETIGATEAVITVENLPVDGKNHTLTAKFTKLDGHNVDKGCEIDGNFVAPGIPSISLEEPTVLDVSCDAATFNLDVNVTYAYMTGTQLLFYWDGELHPEATKSISYGASASISSQLTGLKSDNQNHTLEVKTNNTIYDCQDSHSVLAPIKPTIKPTNFRFSDPNPNCDLTTTLTFDLEYTYQQGKLSFSVDGLDAKEAEFTEKSKTMLTLKDLTVEGISADGKDDHKLHIGFSGANSCNKTFDLPEVPFSPVIDEVTITDVPANVICGTTEYTITVSVTPHFAEKSAGRQIILTVKKGDKDIPTDPIAIEKFPYKLTAYNVAQGKQTITAAFADAPHCTKPAEYTTPEQLSCKKDSGIVCVGQEFPWLKWTYKRDYPCRDTITNPENIHDTLILIVKAKPSLTLGKADMTCDQANEVRLPITKKGGDPDLFDVTIDGKPIPGCAIKGSDFVIPLTGLEAGDHTGSVAVQETGLSCDSTTSFSFSVAISNQMFSKWTDVLFINNKGDKYKAYQWFADGVEMKDETQQRLYDPKGLSGSATVYYCRLTTTDGLTLYTCPQTFDEVTPSRTQNTGENKVQSTRIYDNMGRSINGTPHNGIYIIVEQLEDGDTRVRKIIK